jgi:hypothetical protein
VVFILKNMNEPNITLIAEEKFLALQLIKPNKRAFPPLDAFTEYRRPIAEMILNADQSRFDYPEWFYDEWDALEIDMTQKNDLYSLLAYLSDVAIRIELTALHSGKPMPDPAFYADILKEKHLREESEKLIESLLIDTRSGIDLETIVENSIKGFVKIGEELIK